MDFGAGEGFRLCRLGRTMRLLGTFRRPVRGRGEARVEVWVWENVGLGLGLHLGLGFGSGFVSGATEHSRRKTARSKRQARSYHYFLARRIGTVLWPFKVHKNAVFTKTAFIFASMATEAKKHAFVR